jgi:NTE family protein
MSERKGRRSGLVLSGGLALGAYQAGACAALEQHGTYLPGHIAAASVGAVNAALLAGSPPGEREACLRAFWEGTTTDLAPAWFDGPLGMPWRQGLGLANALQSHFWGRPGIFHRRLLPEMDGRPGLHDLAPLRARLEQLVDFERLNSGEVRLSLVSTDLSSGEAVIFDTARGQRIGPEHVLASCALTPIFAPIEIEGRLLGDGGFSSNTPLDLMLRASPAEDLLCFAVDLFARQGQAPRSLGAAVSRALDLFFGNQTQRQLEAQLREQNLRAVIAQLGEHLPAALRTDPGIAPLLVEGSAARMLLLMLDFRAGPQEIGPGKVIDYSTAALRERWQGGAAHMRAALQLTEQRPEDAEQPGLLALPVPFPEGTAGQAA